MEREPQEQVDSQETQGETPKSSTSTKKKMRSTKGLPPWLGGGEGNGNVAIVGGVQKPKEPES